MVESYECYGRLLIKKGFWTNFVFETARDLLLKKKPRALKILTNADLFQISKLFPDIKFRKNREESAYLKNNGLPVYFYISDYPFERSVRIPGNLEVTKNARLKAVKTSLFNVNSFIYDIKDGIFYDPLDAYPFLKDRIIKTLEPPEVAVGIFPTIAVKTAKVLGETGFELDGSLSEILFSHAGAHGYQQIDEAVADDFLAICVSENAYAALVFLHKVGVLERLIPEVTRLEQVNQDKDHHPEGNGFWHTLECLKCVKKPNKNLMMALLLHDTGKAVTADTKRKGRPFQNHSSMSEIIARKVLRRFHFNKEDRDEVLFLVQNHMILNAVDRLPDSKQRNIFTSPYFTNLLELYRADLESGYHNVDRYFHAARASRKFLKADRLRNIGVYAPQV
jgi:tRNA nucleotidyltransferase/poly(A) polymerase